MTELFSGDTGLWMLFSTGFLSATLLPGGSEANLIAALTMGDIAWWKILLTVSIGNTLGGLTNYGIGVVIPNSASKNRQFSAALTWIKRYGYWTLLFSWLPVVGDPLCLVAGWLRLRFWPCVCLIFVGKAVRYTALAALVVA